MRSNPLSVRHPGFRGILGVARADITPPVGIYHRNWGAATHETAEGILETLTLTVLTLQTAPDAPPLILAGADLGWWRDPRDEWQFRKAVLDALNLDPARFLLNFSHTHAGPVLCRDDADKPGGHLIGPYLDSLRDTVIETTRRALAEASARTLDFAYGKCTLAANRDLPDPANPSRFLCGYNPSAPADDTVLAGRLIDADGVIHATIINYACHPTVLGPENRKISPDFIWRVRMVGGISTGHKKCLFLQGASGELAPREQYAPTIPSDHLHDKGHPFAVVRNGTQLGWAVQSTIHSMLLPEYELTFTGSQESGAPLALWKQTPITYPTDLSARLIEVELPLKPEWQGESALEREWAASEDPALHERLRRRLRIRNALGGGATAKMPLWVWKMGDAFLVAHPNEAYSALQTEIRAAFPETAVLVCNVTNGWYGYLPPADLYDTDRYAVWQTPFAAGSLEILIDAAKAAIRDLGGGDGAA